MPSSGSVDPADVHAALTDVAARLGRLVRSIADERAHAVGSWDAVDVSVHLAHVWETLTALADSGIDSPLGDVTELAALTETLVRDDPDRDPDVLATRIEARAAAFLADPASLRSETLSPWLVRGVAVPRVAFACHILSECLVHGHDIARSQHARWTIEPAHAGLALMGFAFPLLSRLDARALVDQERARGLRASYDVTVRGCGHVLLTIGEGAVTVTPDARAPVDCHLSVEPATLLLLLFGRISQWQAVRTGRLVAWGRRPWLGVRLRQVLRNP